MNEQQPKRPFSLPMVPASFIALLIVGALLYWWLAPRGDNNGGGAGGPFGSGILEPFRTPGGTLHTNGILKTEELRKQTGSWRGTTSSGIRLNATYRYDIELRQDWNIHVDEERRIAFVVAPAFKPQLPVAVDSKSIQTWSESGWGRFDKHEHLSELQREISPVLAKKANSKGYRDLARGDARTTVEEFVKDWILNNGKFSNPKDIVIKVYFDDEKDIPFPGNRSLTDFLP